MLSPETQIESHRPGSRSEPCADKSVFTRGGKGFALVALLTSLSTSIWAQESSAQIVNSQKLGSEIIETLVYSAIGIIMAVIGFKVVDWLTPGSLAEEVAHKENRALAILAGSMMLGVCIIIASVPVS